MMSIVRKYLDFLKENKITEGPRAGRKDIESVDLSNFQFGGEYEFVIPYDKFNESPSTAIKRTISELEELLGVKIKDSPSSELRLGELKTVFRMTRDDSVKGKKFEDSWPLEFITPVLDYENFIAVTKKVFIFIAKRGFETNGTTGFHVGISYKDSDKNLEIDPLKLVLFSGEKFLRDLWPRVRYEIQQGRMSSDYVKSNVTQLKKILKKIIYFDDKLDNLDTNDLAIQIKGWLDEQYRSWIKMGKPEWREKHQAINIGRLDDGYVEFRLMGGEGYENRLSDVEINLKRFTLSLEQSRDPSNKKEYMKKLYKLISTTLNDLEDYDKMGHEDDSLYTGIGEIKNPKTLDLMKRAEPLFIKNPKLKEAIYNIVHGFENKSKEYGIAISINILNNKFNNLSQPALLRSVLAMLLKIYGVTKPELEKVYDENYFEPGKIPQEPEDEDNAPDEWWDWVEGYKTEFKYSKDQLYKLFAI